MRVILPGNAPLALARTFADVSPGEPIGYIGSDGLLEIGVNGGIAASLFRAAPGAEVVLRSP
jgi:S-adenosylmethionine hydrolase